MGFPNKPSSRSNLFHLLYAQPHNNHFYLISYNDANNKYYYIDNYNINYYHYFFYKNLYTYHYFFIIIIIIVIFIVLIIVIMYHYHLCGKIKTMQYFSICGAFFSKDHAVKMYPNALFSRSLGNSMFHHLSVF